MSACLRRNGPMLRLLCHAKPGVVKAVLKNASPDLLKSILECASNVLKGNVPVTPSQKRLLARYKKDLRCLVNKKISLKRKKVIIQKGGFIGALLKPIAGILGTILSL